MTTINLTTLRAQVYALKSQVDALLMVIDTAFEEARAVAGGCPHPEERRRSAGTMTHPRRFICLDCNTEVDP